MKLRLLILLTACLPCWVMSQDTAVAYSEVVPVEGVSKNDLVLRARQWSTDHLKSVQEQKLDSQTTVLSGKAFFKTVIAATSMLDSKDNYEIWYVGKIWIKDGRYKYQFTNYEIQKEGGVTTEYGMLTSAVDPPNMKGMMGKGSKRSTWQGCKKDVEKQNETLVNTLKAAMQKPGVSEF